MVAFVPACIATVVLVVLVEDSTGVSAPLVFSMASYINRDSILAAGITVCFANRAFKPNIRDATCLREIKDFVCAASNMIYSPCMCWQNNYAVYDVLCNYK